MRAREQQLEKQKAPHRRGGGIVNAPVFLILKGCHWNGQMQQPRIENYIKPSLFQAVLYVDLSTA